MENIIEKISQDIKNNNKRIKELLANIDYIKEQLSEINTKINKILKNKIESQNEIIKNEVESLINQINNLIIENPEVRLEKKNHKSIIFGIRKE